MNSTRSLLGTAVDSFGGHVEERVGRLRRLKHVAHIFTYLEWTVDGQPLRELVPLDDGDSDCGITPVRNAYADREYEVDYLKAMLGEPHECERTVLPDGRVPLLVCFMCLDVDCGAVTAQIVRDDETVQWRDIARQVSYEPLDLADQVHPVFTLTFTRDQYDTVMKALLDEAQTAVTTRSAQPPLPDSSV